MDADNDCYQYIFKATLYNETVHIIHDDHYLHAAGKICLYTSILAATKLLDQPFGQWVNNNNNY